MRAAWMLLGLVLLSGTAHADKIFRWIGTDNKVHFGDTPPPGAREVQPFGRKVGTGAAAPADTESDAGTEPSEAQLADCTRKQSQLETYRKAARLIERDSLGREREYTDDERTQLIAQTEDQMRRQCPGFQVVEDDAS